MRIAVMLVVALLLVAPAAATPQSGADGAKAVLITQARLFAQGKFRVMYESTYTPNYRARCPWRTFQQGQSGLRRYLGVRFTVRDVRARILSARQALLAYRFVRANGQTALVVTFRQHDLYAKIGNRWYDERDRSGC
jgi:hypothetical protein